MSYRRSTVRRLMRTRRAKALIGAGAGLGLVAAASSVAQAAIPGPGGVIYACYDKKTGNVRIYDVAKTSCKTSEVRITWNQVGPMGAGGNQYAGRPPRHGTSLL